MCVFFCSLGSLSVFFLFRPRFLFPFLLSSPSAAVPPRPGCIRAPHIQPFVTALRVFCPAQNSTSGGPAALSLRVFFLIIFPTSPVCSLPDSLHLCPRPPTFALFSFLYFLSYGLRFSRVCVFYFLIILLLFVPTKFSAQHRLFSHSSSSSCPACITTSLHVVMHAGL